jgi:hypothetical protein
VHVYEILHHEAGIIEIEAWDMTLNRKLALGYEAHFQGYHAEM